MTTGHASSQMPGTPARWRRGKIVMHGQMNSLIQCNNTEERIETGQQDDTHVLDTWINASVSWSCLRDDGAHERSHQRPGLEFLGSMSTCKPERVRKQCSNGSRSRRKKQSDRRYDSLVVRAQAGHVFFHEKRKSISHAASFPKRIAHVSAQTQRFHVFALHNFC